ncbi:hypothetical protein ACFE04_002463 [Oxalis oulophora]
MGFTFAISLLCFCILICLRIERAQAFCYDTGNFTANSIYSRNRDTILDSLASNAASNGGFYNSTIGNGSDTVYATALCRGDASETECSSCVTTTAHNLISECPLQYEAVSWSGSPQCVVHYANKYIFGVLEMDSSFTFYNTGTISWNSSGFYQTWGGLMEKLKNQASAGSSKLKYAQGRANFTLTRYIYAMVQCTPDLSKSDCEQCLTQSIADYESSLYGYQGGVIYRTNCIYQCDLFQFYNNDVDNAPLLSPTSTKGKGGLSAKIIAVIVNLAVIFIALLAVGLYVFRQHRRRRMKTVQLAKIDEDITTNSEFLHLDFGTIRGATDNFSDSKKLGQGGFGPVYKGTLTNGQQIAVKRLARNSIQGELEFQTEVKLMSKLRHRNLLRLVGFSMEKEERVLVYEFLPNASLNHYIFRKIL